jgi:hypothetical protein
MAISEDQIRAMTPLARGVLYRNAQDRLSSGGQQIVDFIEREGLPLSEGDMLSSDPDYIEMERIIWSAEGIAAAEKAVDAGFPALAGIDPLIKRALKDRYHSHNGGTINAGYLTAQLMRHRGYIEAGSGKIADGVAKTGMRWKRS